MIEFEKSNLYENYYFCSDDINISLAGYVYYNKELKQYIFLAENDETIIPYENLIEIANFIKKLNDENK